MRKILKSILGVCLGGLIVSIAFAKVVQRNNSQLEISQYRMLFTNDGTTSGTKIMDINSGGKVIVYGPLMDNGLNTYITGGALSAYITGSSWTKSLDNIYNNNTGIVTIGDIINGNSSSFSASGFQRYNGSAMAWDDIQNQQRFPSAVTAQQPTQLALASTLVQSPCFTGLTQMQEIFGTTELPHDLYNSTGAILSPHVDWMGTTTEATTTGTWTLDYGIMKANSIYPTLNSTGTITFITKGITGRMYRTDDLGKNIAITGYNVGDTIARRLSRTPTGTDTYTGNMCMIKIGFHYQRDTNGSRTEYTK